VMGVRIPPGLPYITHACVMNGEVMAVEVKGIVNKVKQFLREVRAELKKITWPGRKETIASTVVVIVIVLISGVYLGIVDAILSRLIRYIVY
jgi:preprotein translocase subunit SecE